MAKKSNKGAQRADKPAATPVVEDAKAAEEVLGGASVKTEDTKAAEETETDKKAKKAEAARVRRAKEKQEKGDVKTTEARGHFVAEGKSLTSKKGIVSAGDRVSVANWDEATLEKLCKSGAVVVVK